MDMANEQRRSESKPKVAVYGTLKHQFANHAYLEGAKLISVERIPYFTMYPCIPQSEQADERWGYPICVPSDNPENMVHVEVYEIKDDQMFYLLDSLEGYPRMYQRKLVQTSTGEAWIYYQSTKPNTEIITSGEW